MLRPAAPSGGCGAAAAGQASRPQPSTNQLCFACYEFEAGHSPTRAHTHNGTHPRHPAAARNTIWRQRQRRLLLCRPRLQPAIAWPSPPLHQACTPCTPEPLQWPGQHQHQQQRQRLCSGRGRAAAADHQARAGSALLPPPLLCRSQCMPALPHAGRKRPARPCQVSALHGPATFGTALRLIAA